MAHDVFISYSRKDSSTVSLFVQRIRNAGFSVWIDENGIESGEAFKRVITQAIMDSQIVLFFSSQAANTSEWTAKEIGIASHLHKHIIPVKLDTSSYNLEIMFDLINIDFIDYTVVEKREGMIEKLIHSISNITGKNQSEESTLCDELLSEIEIPETDIEDIEEIEDIEDIEDIEIPEIEIPDISEDIEVPEYSPSPAANVTETVFKVRLLSPGCAKLAALKAVKDFFGISLAEAKDIVDRAPITIDRVLDKKSADSFIEEINYLGGQAEKVSSQGVVKTSSSARIRLTSVGAMKLQFVKILREGMNISLSRALDYVNNVPVLIDETISMDMARSIKEEIENNGGRAEIV